MSYGHGDAQHPAVGFGVVPSVPLLTKRIHPLPFADPSLPVQPRSMDPSKDLAVGRLAAASCMLHKLLKWSPFSSRLTAAVRELGKLGGSEFIWKASMLQQLCLQ